MFGRKQRAGLDPTRLGFTAYALRAPTASRSATSTVRHRLGSDASETTLDSIASEEANKKLQYSGQN